MAAGSRWGRSSRPPPRCRPTSRRPARGRRPTRPPPHRSPGRAPRPSRPRSPARDRPSQPPRPGRDGRSASPRGRPAPGEIRSNSRPRRPPRPRRSWRGSRRHRRGALGMERRGGRRGRTDMLEQRLGRVPQPHAVDQLGLRAAGIAVRQQRAAGRLGDVAGPAQAVDRLRRWRGGAPRARRSPPCRSSRRPALEPQAEMGEHGLPVPHRARRVGALGAVRQQPQCAPALPRRDPVEPAGEPFPAGGGLSEGRRRAPARTRTGRSASSTDRSRPGHARARRGRAASRRWTGRRRRTAPGSPCTCSGLPFGR